MSWPAPNLEGIEDIVTNGAVLADLWQESRVRFHDNGSHAEEVVDFLFPENSLICLGVDDRNFDTRTREEWRGHLAEMALIVPSPMSARAGTTKEERVSVPTLNNAGPRRFLVVECDFAIHARRGKAQTPFSALVRRIVANGHDTLDMGAAIVRHLAMCAPLALAVHSGGQSLQGWFFCDGKPESHLIKFMAAAVSLGANRATWDRSRFVRLPDGTHENGKRQRIYYFDPAVIPEPRGN